MDHQKLIVIRGNSGSGKSAVAEQLRQKIQGKVALIGQDTLRRTILMETDNPENTDIIGLMRQTVVYCLTHGYTVILEGILSKPKYRTLLLELIESASCPTNVFYIDVSLEQTLERHKTKPIAGEVTEEQLRAWYQPKNYLNVTGEIIIDESSSLEETVDTILNIVK